MEKKGKISYIFYCHTGPNNNKYIYSRSVQIIIINFIKKENYENRPNPHKLEINTLIQKNKQFPIKP